MIVANRTSNNKLKTAVIFYFEYCSVYKVSKSINSLYVYSYTTALVPSTEQRRECCSVTVVVPLRVDGR
jgi:hypothetical protein